VLVCAEVKGGDKLPCKPVWVGNSEAHSSLLVTMSPVPHFYHMILCISLGIQHCFSQRSWDGRQESSPHNHNSL